MYKNFLKILLLLCLFVTSINVAIADDTDEWQNHLDIYNSDGLDKPVNAVEYKKVMQKLEDLKNRSKRKKLKKGEMPPPSTYNEPVKVQKNDIIKITNTLYYDGEILPIGFYKVACQKDNDDYLINLSQGKNTIISVKANKVSHMNFCPDKVNCLETEVYQDKYYKINYKTIDYAVSAYLAIVK